MAALLNLEDLIEAIRLGTLESGGKYIIGSK